jgi:hypothetical protein
MRGRFRKPNCSRITSEAMALQQAIGVLVTAQMAVKPINSWYRRKSRQQLSPKSVKFIGVTLRIMIKWEKEVVLCNFFLN